MKRDDVIKVLENAIRMGKFHSYMIPKISYVALKETIALIRELTDQNERLKLDVEVCGAELSRYTENVAKMCEETKADTVRKMLDMLREKANTIYCDESDRLWYEAVELADIEQVAQELLGGEQK